MANTNNLQKYIEQKLEDLNNKKDAAEMIYKGRFSFGLDEREYGHLQGWNQLVKKKKNLVKWIWLDAFFLSLLVTGITTDVFDKFNENWWRALIGLIALSLVIMLFFAITAYYNLFVKFRDTEREVRRIIYQDLLTRLKKEKEMI